MRLSATLAFTLIATPALALDLPPRKPGLWEMKMTFVGRKVPAQVFQHCIDAATDKEMNSLGNSQAAKCSKQDMQRSGDTITVDSVCDMGMGTSTSHAVVTGSFDSAYTVNVDTKREGGPEDSKQPPETKMQIDAKWLSACASDQKPGDIIMAGGRKINIHDMQKMRAGAVGSPAAPGGAKK
jgi:hypothetical protein